LGPVKKRSLVKSKTNKKGRKKREIKVTITDQKTIFSNFRNLPNPARPPSPKKNPRRRRRRRRRRSG